MLETSKVQTKVQCKQSVRYVHAITYNQVTCCENSVSSEMQNNYMYSTGI